MHSRPASDAPVHSLFDEKFGQEILRLLLLLFSLGAATQLLAGLLDQHWWTIVEGATALLLCLTCALLLRNNLRLASYFTVWGLWLFILLSAYFSSNNRAVGLVALPLIIIVCAWVLHVRATQWMTGSTILILLALTLHESNGGDNSLSYAPISGWLTQSLFIVAAATFSSRAFSLYWLRQHKQSELIHHLDVLIDHVPACVCSVDKNHRYLYANRLYANFFGFEPKDIVGKLVAEVIGEENFEARRDIFEAANHGCISHYRRDHINPATGLRRVIDVDLVPEHSALGQQTTPYFGLLREITEEVLAIEEARKSADRFAILFRANPFPTSISQMDEGTFIDVNRAYEEMYGIERKNIIGKGSIGKGLWSKHEEREAWISTLGDGHGRHDYETQITTKLGATLDVILTSERIDIDGQARLLTLHNDITARKNAEREVHRLNETLEQQVKDRTAALSEALTTLQRSQEELIRSEKLASLGGMVAGLAHELNTPIGNAVTVASTLAEHSREFMAQIQSGEGLRKSLLINFCESSIRGTDVLLRNLERGHHLILNFKQVAVDQTSENRRRFLLDQTVDEIVASMSPALKRQPIKIHANIPANIELDSFPGALGQVLINLINNAILHGFDGRQQGIINIYAETDSGASETTPYVRLFVEDNGIGIPVQNLGRIFEPFFTTKFGQGGSGLGLSIIYNIVTGLLGGEIHCESTPETGARFILSLPFRAPEIKS